MNKSFFFGLFTVYDWEWLWGRTAAQIELRMIDQPIVVYKADSNKKKPWENGTVSGDYANKAYQKWLSKKKQREAEGKNVDIAKIFGKGRRVDFQHFIKTGEQKDL